MLSDEQIRVQRDKWDARCHFCGGPSFPWLTDDETWAEVEPLLGQHQACFECFMAARFALGLNDGEPMRVRRHLLAAEAKPDDTLTRAVELLKYAKATYAIRCHHPACPVPDGFCTRCKIDAFLAEIGEVTPEGGMG